ncbi:hypothetical protein D3C86_2044750 [compost metagenome]
MRPAASSALCTSPGTRIDAVFSASVLVTVQVPERSMEVMSDVWVMTISRKFMGGADYPSP